jgi:hypothetical protein
MGRIMNFCADQLRTRICGRAERILKHCFVQCQPKCCVGILTLHNMNWIVFVVKKGHSCWSRADIHIIYDVILYLLFFLIFCWCSTIFFPICRFDYMFNTDKYDECRVVAWCGLFYYMHLLIFSYSWLSMITMYIIWKILFDNSTAHYMRLHYFFLIVVINFS